MADADEGLPEVGAIAGLQANVAGLALAPCPVPAAGVKELVVLRIVDDADLAVVVLDVSDRHAVVAHPTQEVVGAVDRVDDPDVIELALERRRGLFAEEGIAGKRRGEAASD